MNIVWSIIENLLSTPNEFRINPKVRASWKLFGHFRITVIILKWGHLHINFFSSWPLPMFWLFVLLRGVKVGKFLFKIWALCSHVWIWHSMLCSNVVIHFLLSFAEKVVTLRTCFFFYLWYSFSYVKNWLCWDSVHSNCKYFFRFDREKA